MPTRSVFVAPASRPAMFEAFGQAVHEAGGEVVDDSGADRAEALIWADPAAAGSFPGVAAQMPALRWVQLPYAGVEPFAAHLDSRYTWTCGKGVYAPPVAEHALTLALAGLRGLTTYARASSWQPPQGTNLLGAPVTILGGGGITDELLALLAPFGCNMTVVRRHPRPMPGASSVVGADQLADAVADAAVVFVAWALTPETAGRIDAAVLSRMGAQCWLVNVGRGGHVVTDDLVDALESGVIAGAALDVTDPEPLPEGHRLWELPNCIITPHIANTPEMGLPLIAARVGENVARWIDGRPLVGLVDVALGY